MLIFASLKFFLRSHVCQSADFRICADSDDAIAHYGDSFRAWFRRVHRSHIRVDDNQISR